MQSSTEFIDSIRRRKQIPELKKVDGSIRFDVTNGRRTRHMLVRLKDGNVSVSEEMADADCVISGDQGLFDSVVKGETNTMAALLRGALRVEGDLHLAVLVQRLFPGPPTSRPRTQPSRERDSR
jgi:putative sterol carrier protein